VVGDVKKRFADIQFPLEYNAEILGKYAESQNAKREVLVYSLAAAIGIVLLLQVVFSSWRLAILSFVTLPSALVGGILALFLGNGIVSLGALVGFLTVFGIAARNTILLIHHCQHLEKYEGETFGSKLVLRGAKERLAPILITSATAGIGLVPLVIVGDVPDRYARPPSSRRPRHFHAVDPVCRAIALFAADLNTRKSHNRESERPSHATGRLVT
jgi:Cu/Ag efflux pump CusA